MKPSTAMNASSVPGRLGPGPRARLSEAEQALIGDSYNKIIHVRPRLPLASPPSPKPGERGKPRALTSTTPSGWSLSTTSCRHGRLLNYARSAWN